MLIFKAIFGVFSLIGSFFRIKKAIKLIQKTAKKIKKKCEKRRIKKERLEAKGYLEKENGKSRSLRPLLTSKRDEVAILGTVRAGSPILAEENLSGYIRYADASSYPKGSLFALRIVGDSMIEAGILEGDVVIVCRDIIPSNSDIVVALLENEATVKTFYKEDGHYRLQPENSALSPIIVDELVILGKVIACIREYN